MARRSAHLPALRSALVAAILCTVVERSVAATCGDGVQENGEQCEDGNQVDTSVCSRRADSLRADEPACLQVSGDGCSSSCWCETDPCQFSASSGSVDLASVIAELRPGSTLTLVAGTYMGLESCGWNIATFTGADERPITVRGAQGASITTIIDCDSVGPVVGGTISGAHLRLEGIHFTSSQRSGGSGGVLRAERSRIVIDNCRFTKCASDTEGGAIYVSNSSLTVLRSHFEENSAEDNGGSLAVVEGSDVSLADSTITLCLAGHGGGVYVKRSAMVMHGMLLSHNTALVNKGGAVLVDDNSMMNVSSTIIANNEALRGGGVMVQFSSVLGLTGGVRVVENHANLYGGAVYVLFDASLELSSNVVIDGNFAALVSGGLQLYFHKHFIASGKVIISQNFASSLLGYAGAIYCAGNPGSIVELHEGFRVSGNIAGFSGGVMWAEIPGNVVFARGAIFEDNQALSLQEGTPTQFGRGGAIAISDGASLFLYGCIFRNNSAFSGGGVSDDGETAHVGSVVINDTKFENNVAFGGDGAGLFFGRPAVVARAIFISNNARRSGGGAVFESGSQVTMHDCIFLDNKALNGGALYGNGQGAMLRAVSTTFENNKALAQGGGIFVTGASDLTLSNVEILSNLAHVGGGGICARGQSVVAMKDDVLIRNCETKGMGGGMLAAGARFIIATVVDKRVVVESNKARRSGGGISFMGQWDLGGEGVTQIHGNFASGIGGGIFGYSSFAQVNVASEHLLSIQVSHVCPRPSNVYTQMPMYKHAVSFDMSLTAFDMNAG